MFDVMIAVEDSLLASHMFFGNEYSPFELSAKINSDTGKRKARSVKLNIIIIVCTKTYETSVVPAASNFQCIVPVRSNTGTS